MSNHLTVYSSQFNTPPPPCKGRGNWEAGRTNSSTTPFNDNAMTFTKGLWEVEASGNTNEAGAHVSSSRPSFHVIHALNVNGREAASHTILVNS
jgi:hypothetical protein